MGDVGNKIRTQHLHTVQFFGHEVHIVYDGVELAELGTKMAGEMNIKVTVLDFFQRGFYFLERQIHGVVLSDKIHDRKDCCYAKGRSNSMFYNFFPMRLWNFLGQTCGEHSQNDTRYQKIKAVYSVNNAFYLFPRQSMLFHFNTALYPSP